MNPLLTLAAVQLPAASSFAESTDLAARILLWCAEFFLVLLVGGVLFLLVRSRGGGSTEQDAAAPSGWGRRLVTAGFLVLVAAFFAHGFVLWQDRSVVPRDALAIRVDTNETGLTFGYPGGVETNELHLPSDRAVRLDLAAADVPYALAVPEFRWQVSVPRRVDRSSWLQATLPGEYELRSVLQPTSDPPPFADVVVHAEGEFETWLQEVSGPPLDLPPVELGQLSYTMRGCTQCHTVDGSTSTGPTFFGFVNREHRLLDGTVVEPNEEYIRESILDPAAKVVEGYEPVMPPFAGRLHDLEVAGLVAYIQSLVDETAEPDSGSDDGGASP